MGALTSRQNAGVEEVDIASNHAYKYPPKSGNYFGSHFIMGGERFDTPQPEAYLFGENADLNFLGSRPTPFPYPPPQANEPTKTLKSLVNIRKESLRLVRTVGVGKADGDILKPTVFNIEFTFDCDCRTAITIYYFATEDITPAGLTYNSRDSSLTSETFFFKRGSNQLFSQPTHIFDPTPYTDEELAYNPDKEIFPIVIHCVAQEGPEDQRQSHTTVSIVERHADGNYMLKALKQKLFVDGLVYLLQEIYGIENKACELSKGGSDDETEDNGSECVICMCDMRDTLILPCRHLCLCNSCADSLRYQANNCPICRAPFRALLQIRALQKTSTTHMATIPSESSCDNIPAGYEPVSLIEALNGPAIPRLNVALEPLETPLDHESAMQAAQVLNRSGLVVKIPPEEFETGEACQTPELRMSILLAKEAEGCKEKNKSPPLAGRRREKAALRLRDSVKVVNETMNNQDETQDEDSEAEKLSPLLDVSANTESLPITSQLCGNDVKSETLNAAVGGSLVVSAGGDDSDYYTPEDPATTILSPIHCDKIFMS
uniref:RING-type E3 ubiquitin transferase n=1 Tax=Clastoptera arizonana TaxID=38151 RepID=A0A1B6E1R7_9HEMI